MSPELRSRKNVVLKNLEAQLLSGVKTEKGTTDVKIPLTDKDRKRIEKEIQTLKKHNE